MIHAKYYFGRHAQCAEVAWIFVVIRFLRIGATPTSFAEAKVPSSRTCRMGKQRGTACTCCLGSSSILFFILGLVLVIVGAVLFGVFPSILRGEVNKVSRADINPVRWLSVCCYTYFKWWMIYLIPGVTNGSWFNSADIAKFQLVQLRTRHLIYETSGYYLYSGVRACEIFSWDVEDGRREKRDALYPQFYVWNFTISAESNNLLNPPTLVYLILT